MTNQTQPGQPCDIRVVGMSRSGNHAIINWILSQLRGRWAFLNCVEPQSDPFDSARPLDCGNTRLVSHADLATADAQAVRGSVDTLVFSQEDVFLQPALGAAAQAVQGVDGRGVDVIVLRDPYSLMASRKRFDWCFVTPLTERRIWKQHARRVRDRGNFGRRRFVPVLYNRWVAERDYRAAIAAALGVPFTDRNWNRTATCAGGSSFGSLARPAHGVLDRWRAYADDPSYWAMIDEEMEVLAKAVFGLDHPLSPEKQATAA